MQVCQTFTHIDFTDTGYDILSLEPEPVIERMEETTNKINLALEIPEDNAKGKPGGFGFLGGILAYVMDVSCIVFIHNSAISS